MPLRGWTLSKCCRLERHKDLLVFVAVISELCLCKYRVLCRYRIRCSGVHKTFFDCQTVKLYVIEGEHLPEIFAVEFLLVLLSLLQDIKES